jgi:hypothetical protein
MSDLHNNSHDYLIVEHLRTELAKSAPSRRRRITEKFILAAIGSIPWVGGFLSAAASYKADDATIKQNTFQTQWLEEHHKKLIELRETLEDIERRFASFGTTVDERVQSEEYLMLVRKAFRAWDDADTKAKRRIITNTITNAAGARVCSDDVVRLFLDWLDLYHEAHLAVIREIFTNPGSSRFEIWSSLYVETPREDSAEADLFKLLIRDLSTGGVIRQERDVNNLGQFVRKTPQRKRSTKLPTTFESAFEDTKPYILTELGKQFVHYTMNEVVDRIEE